MFDIKSGEKKDHFAFPAPVAATIVAATGEKALVLTTDQIIYWISLSGEHKADEHAVAAQ
jgi:hypothetical protein